MAGNGMAAIQLNAGGGIALSNDAIARAPSVAGPL